MSSTGNITTTRVYLGSAGNVTHNDALDISNTSGSTNSQVYCNHNGVGIYSGNITLEVDNASCDGILFGNGGSGSGTLAAGQTVSIVGNGYNSGYLYFRDFVQTGGTAQALAPTGTTIFQLIDSDWGGNVTFSGPRMLTQGTVYNGTASLTKNGATNDASAGGNDFKQNTTLNCTGAGYLGMGNGATDTFRMDLDIVNSGANNFYLAMNSLNNYVGGDITLTHSGSAIASYLTNNATSSLIVDGSIDVTNTSSAANSSTVVGTNGNVTIGGDLDLTNSATGATSNNYVANGASSAVTVAGAVTLINAGAGATTQRIYLANNGDITIDGDLTIQNSSAATNSQVYCDHGATSVGLYNGNITITSEVAGCDGVWFGQGTGSGTLAAGNTVSIVAPGFVDGYMYFRNFTQVGPTAQTLTGTGTSYFYSLDSDWGGDVTFTAPQVYTAGTVYNGTADLTKTGAGNNYSAGNNYFAGNTSLTNSSAAIMAMGNGAADTFMLDLDVLNSGTSLFYLGYNGGDNYVGGNVTATTNGAALSTVIGQGATSTLDIDGNVIITNTSSGLNSNSYLGNAADVTVGGDVSSTNSGTGTSTTYFASGAGADLTIDGNTTVVNDGLGGTTCQHILGNNGNVTFQGTLDIVNSSTSTNSRVYAPYGGTNIFNDDITVQNTNILSDGVFFGLTAASSGTLAATKTVTVGAGGFMDGDLYFRNFTQIGPTAQSLTTTNDNVFTIYDSDWGGDITFTGPTITTRGTRYNLTSRIEKTGTTSDASVGGNVFVGNLEMVNSGGPGYLLFSNGNPDSCNANLTMTNSGSGAMYFAYNAAGCTVDGDLVANMTGATTTTQVSSLAASTLEVGGDATFTASSSAASSSMYAGSAGDVNFNGKVRMTNNATGAQHNMYLGNAAGSVINVTDSTIIDNSGTGATTQRAWLGSSGTNTYNGPVTLHNGAGATNSDIFVAYNATAVASFNENIVVECTNASSDGIRFGWATGNSTLAATKTVTIGGAGYIAGYLGFRNFTQVGPTAHTLIPTGTTLLYNYDSDWGGDVIFTSPRHITRGTHYNGTAHLEKNGATDDQSVGGNVIDGDCELVCSGSGYFLMGNGTADSFMVDLDMLNSGSRNLYMGYNSAGNYVGGNLTVDHTGSATNTYLSNATASTVDIVGTAVVTHTSDATNSYVYLGDQGDIDFGSTLDMTNTGAATATNSEIRLGNNTNSTVTVAGACTATNQGTGNNSRIYLGNVGDIDFQSTLTLLNGGTSTNGYIIMANNAASNITVANTADVTNTGANNVRQTFLGSAGTITFNGALDILNSSSATNSQVYANYNATGVGNYNGNITVQSTDANCDGILFGSNGGTGTLAAGQTVTVGAGGFIAGMLRFRNFTQVGGTAQNATITGTSHFDNYNSEWNGNVDFRGPRHTTRGTTYNGTAYLEKTGAVNDASVGGNTFNDDATMQNSGSGYFMPANATPNDFNADATYVRTSTGLVYPTYNCASTYAGDINIDYITTQIRFGAAGNGRVIMDGTGPQSINDVGASMDPEIRDLQTLNPNDEITLNIPVEIITELDLDQGNIISSSANLLYMWDNSNVSSVSDDAFVDGPIEKIGNDVFTFPVGDLGVYQPIAMTAPASGGARFRAEYFNTDVAPVHGDTLLEPTIHHISDCEYWTLDRIATTNNVSVTLAFKPHTGACSGVTDPTTLVVARWDGSIWRDEGNDGAPTGTPTAGTITSAAAVTNFSPFTLASTVNFPDNPLPVELVTWEAVGREEVVDLLWSTASETNNDYFTIEKSADGVHFETFLTVDGAGNSSQQINYAEVDHQPYHGWNYYRLKQTDFDGTTTDHGIVKVHFSAFSDGDITIYPNPSADGLFNIDFTQQVEGAVVEIMDEAGKLVYNTTFSGSKLVIQPGVLPAGMYVFRYIHGEEAVTRKLVVR